ncbi:fumarylacetoacetate hydrolase family protein [Actinotalea sp. Marseille-Q4924]|uniref:fumarylacetoacetate hydrolase family protein n=1 Tax=Actinotalea sp. Marseille-Q4924 TaxID=2866571 RepID=UPI001CE3BE11|nr:fumarylacetoacetate hydrolase family protein [Actinotalea sp. Marseille-Q4924]
MRIGRARVDQGTRTVVVLGDGGPGAEAAVLPDGAPTPDDVVREPSARGVVEGLVIAAPRAAVEDLPLLLPLSRFNRDILCTGWNYWDHFEESAGKREGQDPAERPSHPTFFTKGPLTAIGPRDPIAFDPHLSAKWDYEAEVALVIGRAGRSIPEDRAFDHVAGYLVANDVSQRDLQRAHGGQWLKGKSIDGTMPLGPWVTTADDVPDVQDLQIRFELNGHELQSARTRQMAFSVAQIVAELSAGMTLLPGDVVLTGTPSGIGNAREPQVFLAEGDELVTRVEGLGELRNTMVLTDLAGYSPRADHR